MLEPQVVVVVGVIAFGATLVRSTLGFGDALIAMPLLAFILPLRVAAPYVAGLSVFNAIIILIHEWKLISFREVRRLIPASLCGIPMGIWMLRDGDPRAVTGLLAILVLSFSAWNLWRPDSLQLRTDRTAPLFGFLSGVLGGACNTAGPTLVMFGTLRRWPAGRFRANLQSYFVVSGTLVFVSHLWHGHVTRPVLQLFLLGVPLTLISAAVGRRIAHAVPTARFIRYVHAGLMLIGLTLLGRTLSAPTDDLAPPPERSQPGTTS